MMNVCNTLLLFELVDNLIETHMGGIIWVKFAVLANGEGTAEALCQKKKG